MMIVKITMMHFVFHVGISPWSPYAFSILVLSDVWYMWESEPVEPSLTG